MYFRSKWESWNIDIWGTKTTFVTARGVMAVIGLVRTVAIVRILGVDEYALIGIVEAARSLIWTLVGFGIGDGFAREGAAEQDHKKRGLLTATAYAAGILSSLVAALCMMLAATFGAGMIDDPRLENLFWVSILVGTTEWLWLLSVTVLRIESGYRTFIFGSVVYGALVACSAVLGAYLDGASGYLHGQWVASSLVLVGIVLFLRQCVSWPSLKELVVGWKNSIDALWDVAWFSYIYKGSGAAWRRLPILAGAPVVSTEAIGIVAATLDLASKIHMLHEVLAPLIVQRLSICFNQRPKAFVVEAKKEVNRMLGLTVLALGVAAIVWMIAGSLLVGVERWQMLETAFLFGLLVEGTLAATNSLNICIMTPARGVKGLLLPTILIRLSVIPCLYGLAIVGFRDWDLILLSMLIPGIALVVLYGKYSQFLLHRLHQSY